MKCLYPDKCLFLLLFLVIQVPVFSQYKFYADILPGTALILPSPLKITQTGYKDLELNARYETRSFNLPPYYSIRAGMQINNNTALELEFNHLKLFLLNKPEEITGFSISHGYNQFWFNILRNTPLVDIRAGIGPVIPHPENTVRGMRLDPNGGFHGTGYYLHGVTAQLAVQKQISFLKRFFIDAEAKLNYSYTNTLVVNGRAMLSVFALHVLVGAGMRFGEC